MTDDRPQVENLTKAEFLGDDLELGTVLAQWHQIDPGARLRWFQALSVEDATYFFADLSSSEQADLCLELPTALAATLLRSMRLDNMADLIQKLPEENREGMLGSLDDQTRRDVTGLLAYEEDEAGGLMNPRYIRIRPDMTVGAAARYLSLQAKKNVEIYYYAYVLSFDQKLIGILSFRDLIMADQDALISEIMHTDIVTVPEEMDQEQVLQLFSKHSFVAIPVVDSEGRMKGVVTHDDLVSVAQQEATEDMHKIGGMEALESPYFHVSAFEMIKKRAGWLSALFIGEMFTASAMAHYQEEISNAVVLALFIPLIISSGGNSGSQASTLIIRSLALKEIRLGDWMRVLWRELGTGLVLGFILSMIGFLRVVLWQQWSPIYGDHYFLIAMTVSLSLIGVVIWGTISGSMLPFILRRLGLDPASASAPFVATLSDVTGLIIYFTIANRILAGALL